MGSFPDIKAERFGRYILLDRINVGGMAEVFRGKMAGVEGFERMVALKRILPNVAADPDFVEMFVDEAKLAVQLQHANIAQIYELGKEAETYFMAMEYVSGVDLRTMWDRARQRNRLLPIAMSCHIMQKVCEGLDAAHRKKDEFGADIGLVHRDVSPQNILVSFEGEAKVIDFGIARAANKVSKTQAGVLKGKFGYMSPEQVRGVMLDNRSDIFACGVVLYELLVGDRLFLGESDFSTLEKVRNVEMVPPTRLNKNLSPHLERIVMKALARTREDRYRWAAEMAEDLQRYLYATNQPFARTDLQRYMQQHFKKEIEKEKARLEKYRQIDASSIVSPEPPKVELPPAPDTPPLQLNSALNPTPLALGDVAASNTEVAAGQQHFGAPTAAVPLASIAPGAQRASGSMAVPAPPERRGLPAWAAGLIGALVVLVLAAGGGLAYLVLGKPTPARITVTVVPEKAEIFLDDVLVSNSSPYIADNLEPTSHVLKVRADGYEEAIRVVRLSDGELKAESFALERKAGTASIIIRSTPPGFEIHLGDKKTDRVTPATLSGLDAGRYRIVVKRTDGSIVHRVQVDLAAGGVEVIEMDEARLPSVLDVASDPPGAEVRVAGAYKGTTPVTVAGLRPGPVRVKLDKKGCEPVKNRVVLPQATILPLNVKLTCNAAAVLNGKEGSTGRLNISATMVADIFIDGQKVGRTPSMGLKLPKGGHTLKLVPLSPDKAPFETDIDVAGGVQDIHHKF